MRTGKLLWRPITLPHPQPFHVGVNDDHLDHTESHGLDDDDDDE